MFEEFPISELSELQQEAREARALARRVDPGAAKDLSRYADALEDQVRKMVASVRYHKLGVSDAAISASRDRGSSRPFPAQQARGPG